MDPKYAIRYTTASTGAVARRASLVEGGPLEFSAEHYLVQVLPAHYFIDQQGTKLGTLHLLEYVFLRAINEWDGVIRSRNLGWYLSPARVSRFLQEADDEGFLDWSGKMRDVDALLSHILDVASKMTEAQRTLAPNDVLGEAPPDPLTSFFEKIKAADLIGS